MPKTFGTELYLTTDHHDRLKEEEAIVQTIQNLCFIKPGTYPNDPDLGLGIEDEQFELIDALYLDNFKNKLDTLIEKYIVTDYVIDTRVTFKYVNVVTSQKVLIIEIFVGPYDHDMSKIDLLFTRMPENNKLKFNIMR